MSEEEEEPIETMIEESETIEQKLAPENAKPTKLNKNGKPRKQISQNQLEILAKAREKAAAIRKQITVKKLEDKIENINKSTEPILGTKPKKETKPEVINEVIEEEEAEVKVVKKKSSKKKPVVIIEQSSSDEEEFEDKKNVIFVKRASRKKKEIPEPQVSSSAPPEPPQPPKPPQLSRQQARFNQTYDSMFNGGFLGNRFY